MIFRSLTVDSIFPAEGHGYFFPGADLMQWRMPVQVKPLSRQNFLFHRVQDPHQRENLWELGPRERSRMPEIIRDLLMREGAPPEQYEHLGINSK